MDTISIKVKTKDHGEYISDPVDYDNEALKILDNNIKSVCSNKVDHMRISVKDEIIYFTTEILKTSVISLIAVKK